MNRTRRNWSVTLLVLLMPLLFSCRAVDDVTGPGGSASGPGGSGSGGPPAATTGSLTLSWDAPSQNEDGSPLTDLAGYNLYYSRTSPVTVANSTLVQLATVTTATVPDLAVGSYFVAVAARDTNGNISALSAELRADVSP